MITLHRGIDMKIVMSLVALLAVLSVDAAIRPAEKNVESFGSGDVVHKKLVALYEKNHTGKDGIKELRKETLALNGKAVPVLIKVMKSDKFPGKNRWVATFMLGKIMGKKSGPFIAKFLEHPNWVMRMASLKTLLALSQKNYGKQYANLLNDNSMIVRSQALDNISRLNLKEFAPNVWAMLYDKKNYHTGTKTTKRAHIVKSIVRTVGLLKFGKAKRPLLAMIQKEKYKDIHEDIDYALEEIVGKKSPKTTMQLKQRFWQQLALPETAI